MFFYEALQETMDKKGLTIPDVARLSNVSDSTIRAIINRKSKSASLEVAFRISKALDVSLEFLNGEVETIDTLDSNESEDDEIDKMAQEIYNTLLKAGKIKEGQQLTDKQIQVLDGVCTVLEALFDSD